MTVNNTATTTTSQDKQGDLIPGADPFSVLFFGLKVVFSEYKRLILDLVRGWELRQLRKRLDQEHALLGSATADLAHERRHASDSGDAPLEEDDETGLILKQVEFLRREIAFLEEERDRLNREFMNARRQRLFPGCGPTTTD